MKLSEFTLYCDQLVHASRNCVDRWRWVREKEPDFLCLETVRHVRSTESNPQTEMLEGMAELDEEDDPGLAAVSGGQPTARMLAFEYHVLYCESYEVPILLFNIYEKGGARLNLEEAWEVLQISGCVPPDERYSAITMVHHPVLYRPYLKLHPCKTAELVGSLSGSTNPVLSFITTYAPYVNLEQDELARALQSDSKKETGE
ncbi:ubiquitin-like-conjugating enzyme ATG10 [Anopheles gambiae]|uniref:ubiquitin-like-conjugating enzyme ATG10 n=1 Tax=Anopheles gambiae TaxID=7165 RepID=UPI001AADD885|nr:ubiquitin-like-conjugating enzyme ATG10 [Anopheles gambiae]